MLLNFKTNSTKETENVGKRLAELLEKSAIESAFIAMRGEMGVGKTAFSRGFASHFGITAVKSPTYSILNEYRGRRNIYHFDFYRISDEDDLYSVGYDDIINAPGYIIGEWSENIESALPKSKITVTIKRLAFSGEETDMRDIEIEFSGIDIKREFLPKPQEEIS